MSYTDNAVNHPAGCPWESDHHAAADLAARAGQLLLAVRTGGGTPESLKDAGDMASHDYLTEELARHFAGDMVVSEEDDQSIERQQSERQWIIDPLDGTREFSEIDRSDWAVHVALVVGGALSAGAVALPARGMTLSTAAPPALLPWTDRPPRILVSRTRPTEHGQRLADKLTGELVPMGSAGAKAMAVVLGEGDVYAHSGGQYEWDSAAPAAVAAAAGLHVSRLDGSPLRYGQPDPWMPDFLVCRPELADDVISICGEV